MYDLPDSGTKGSDMNASIDERWQQFVDSAVKSGRFNSASEVVRDGLRLVEEREAKSQALPDTIDASIAEGGSFTDEEVGEAIVERFAELARQGF